MTTKSPDARREAVERTSQFTAMLEEAARAKHDGWEATERRAADLRTILSLLDQPPGDGEDRLEALASAVSGQKSAFIRLAKAVLAAIDTGRSEPLFIARDQLRNYIEDRADGEAHHRPSAQPEERERALEEAARVAECAFDDRPNSRAGHHSEMDWTDGYRDGTRAASQAILRARATPATGAVSLGANWSSMDRIELPLAMASSLSDAAKARIQKMEQTDAAGLLAACKFPLGSRFSYHDEEGEHDPAYVVMPDGEMLSVNGYADGDAPIPTDCSRTAFIILACNAALRASPPPMRDALHPASPGKGDA